MGKQIAHVFLFLATPLVLCSQKIDNTVSFRTLESESYFRINYENDFFTATDKNYTQGYNLELVSPFLKSNPLNHLFFGVKDVKTNYGISIEHIGFTPNNYVSEAIQFGDRPFAAAIMLKSFSVANNHTKKTRLSQSLSLGLIGSGAFGREMQVKIHEIIGDKIPGGWDNQINNDLVLNFRLAHEKELLRFKNMLSVNSFSALQLGTLFTNASIGFSSVIGYVNSPLGPYEKNKKWQFYIYSQPIITIVGYDATLQGGVFNNKSPYVVSANDISRFTAQVNYGLVVKSKKLYFEYARTVITREFNSGNSAQWGGFKIGFSL
jgi:hypothetical protein